MPLEPAAESAYAQLTRLAAEPSLARRATAWTALSRFPAPEDARAAAVLILFGVLDATRSDHLARDHAVSRDLDVLLLARATTLRSHPGQLAFPGGRADDGDRDPVATALREAEEETGIDPDGIEVLGSLPPLPLAFSGHLVTPVLAWWRRRSPVRAVDAAESADVFRVPVADLLDARNRGVTVTHRDGREWSAPGFLVHRGGAPLVLWGFTAMVLDGLFDQLGWTEPWDRTRTLVLPSSGRDAVHHRKGIGRS